MLETMKRLDAHANALLLTGASDIDLLGGMFDVMPDFKALLDAGYGGEIDKNAGRFPRFASLRRHALQCRRGDRGRFHPGAALTPCFAGRGCEQTFMIASSAG